MFRIKGVTNLEIPKLIYNNTGYNLNNQGHFRFESDRLELTQEVDEVEIRIGSYSQRELYALVPNHVFANKVV